MRNDLPLLFTLVCLAACGSPSAPLDPARLAAIEPGVATEAEVTALLGRPTFATFLPDGNVMFIYSRRSPDPRHPEFLPNAGPFADLGKTETQTVQILIAPDGKVLSVQTTDPR